MNWRGRISIAAGVMVVACVAFWLATPILPYDREALLNLDTMKGRLNYRFAGVVYLRTESPPWIFGYDLSSDKEDAGRWIQLAVYDDNGKTISETEWNRPHWTMCNILFLAKDISVFSRESREGLQNSARLTELVFQAFQTGDPELAETQLQQLLRIVRDAVEDPAGFRGFPEDGTEPEPTP